MDMGDQMNYDSDLPQPPQDNNQVKTTTKRIRIQILPCRKKTSLHEAYA